MMTDAALKAHLPGAEVLAMVGIAVGFGVLVVHWPGLVILPLPVDDHFVLVSYLSPLLALAIVAALLMRAPRGAHP